MLSLVTLIVTPILVSAAGKHELRTPGGKHTRTEDSLFRAEVSSGTLSLSLAPADISMIASPSTPNTPIANLTVTWSGVPNPQSNDWIAIYCTDAPLSGFQEWNYVSVSESWASGSGSMSFMQARSDCVLEFRLYRDPSPYIFLGKSNSIAWSGAGTGAPYQMRISYGYNPQTMMTIGWTSMNQSSDALVMIGESSGVYTIGNFTSFPASTYYAKDLCTAPANTEGPTSWRFPGFFYYSNVTGLKPNTRYYAKALVQGVPSVEINFVSGKEVGANIDTQFVMYGDMSESGIPGAIETSDRVYERITKENDIDFLLHIGDLSYAEGNVNTWDTWMSYIEPYSGLVPYHVSIGNHEYCYEGQSSNDPSGVDRTWSPSWRNCGSDSQGECGVGTNQRFLMPNNGNSVFWYSFTVGNVHIAMISSEHDLNVGSPMGDWLINDLESVDHDLTPWVFVSIHRPLVETEMYESDYIVAQNYREIMYPYLAKNQVDVVLAGHYHSVQRSCFVGANYTCVDGFSNGGIVHYTSGAAGAGLDAVGLYKDPVIEKTILGTWGYSVIHSPNASALHLQFFANVNNSVLDDVWLWK